MPHTDERGALRPVAADRLWSSDECAAFLGRTRATVYAFVAMGLPCVRLTPGRLQFDPDEVRTWAAARKSHSILAPRARERAG